jgi:hypothetical protein
LAARLTLHYQIVHRDDLSLYPAADMALSLAAGALERRVCLEGADWLGGLACHGLGFVIPEALGGDALAGALTAQTVRANEILGPLGGRLLPGGAHPFMDPARETWIWNHDQAEVFSVLDRICNLKRQAWSNQAYASLGVPCADARDFGRTFAALRLLAALIPALAASSPLTDGVDRGRFSERVLAACDRCQGFTGLRGGLLPGPAATPDEYRERELAPLREALAGLDPGGLLAPEHFALRGLRCDADALVVFLDLCDVQECPRADLAVAELILHALDRLRASDAVLDEPPSQAALEALLHASASLGPEAVIEDAALLRALSLGARPVSAGEAWREFARDFRLEPAVAEAAALLAAGGTLAGRIRRALGADQSLENIRRVYGRLCDCLATDTLFDA